jgi:hypothetical protein
MVEPGDVPRIVGDAARLVRRGELVVFGSGALAFWLHAAPRSRDVDLWCDPPERGEVVESLMGELSWYHDRHGVYVEVWGPETFAAPAGWPDRARRLTSEAAPGVTLVVPHPHDVLLAKLERLDPSDLDHARRILAEFPLSPERLGELSREAPYETGRIVEEDRIARFRYGLARLEKMLESA